MRKSLFIGFIIVAMVIMAACTARIDVTEVNDNQPIEPSAISGKGSGIVYPAEEITSKGGDAGDNGSENEVELTQQTQETTKNETSRDAGGINLCKLHAIDFHTFTGEMIDYVGEEQFREWYNDCATKDSGIAGCLYYANIYRFIEDFAFPRAVFEAIYYGSTSFYFSDYDVNVLYDTDAETVSQYYISNDRNEEREKYSTLGEIKFGIAEYAAMSNDPKMNNFFEKYCRDKTIVEWSIADFIRETRIDKIELQKLITDVTVREYPGKTVVLECFDFDYDVLYNTAETMITEKADSTSVISKHNEDLAFCCQSQLSVDMVYENVSVD